MGYDETATVYAASFHTILGWMYAAVTDAGLCLLQFAPEGDGHPVADYCAKRLGRQAELTPQPLLIQVETETHAYLAGARTGFSVPVAQPGTPFQQRVWASLAAIPYGCTVSYSRQAELLGDRNAIRAVAAANGANNVLLAVSCHRIVGLGGKLTGYAGGLARKQWLLRMERRDVVPELFG